MNLLDNWDFTNPVNQRGRTSYSTGSNIANYKYTIDKWQLMNGTLKVNEKSIRFTTSNDIAVSEIYQQLEPILFDSIKGKTVTFSIMINNKLYYQTDSIPLTGSVYTSQSEITGSNNGKFFLDLTYDSTGSSAIYAMFRLFSTARNSYVDIQAVKLEIGSASTLKNDALGVNYAKEFLKCQRYFERSKYQVTYGTALNTSILEHTDTYFYKREKRINECIFTVESDPKQALQVYDVSEGGITPVSNCILAPPTTYNNYCYSPRIESLDNKFVAGRRYLARIGDEAYSISADL